MAVTGKNVMKYIKSDIYCHCGRERTWDVIRGFFISPLARYLIVLRLASSDGACGVIGRFLWRMNWYRLIKRLEIPYTTKIGYGFFLAHAGPVYINETAQIGDNVTVCQLTTIGSEHDTAATIGDGTYIGPNVCIVEDVRIGSNVTIGAGSVVTKDIPDNATACGNYAKVIHYNDPGRLIKNRWNG